MNVHVSSRAERVCPEVFWGETKSGCTSPSGLGLEDHDDIRSYDGEEPLVDVRVVAERSLLQEPLLLYAEEGVYTRP